MKNDATQSDVSIEVTDQAASNDQQQTYVSPRDAAMAAIDERIQLQLQEQGVNLAGDNQSARTPAVPATTDQAADRMLKVKVDGVELEVPESEVVKNYQKVSAADKRLEEAAVERKRLEEERQQFELQKKTGTPAADTNLPDKDDDLLEKATRIMADLNEGDTGSAAQLLAEALRSAKSADVSTPLVDESKVTEIVNNVAAQKEYERDFAKAKETFDAEFGFINENTRLCQLANNIFNEHVASGKMPSEAARLAGEEVKGLFPPATDPMKERQERKQSIDNITPANAVSTSSNAASASDDPKSIIEQMKKERGQG